MKKKIILLSIFSGIFLFSVKADAVTSVLGKRKPHHKPPHKFQPFTPQRWTASSRARPEDLQWFQDARFGLFVHFGVSSLKGVEIGWGRQTRIAPDGGKGPIPDKVYDNLYKQFKLEKFNPVQWVIMAKRAGMKYLVVITKHHDGFHMWDTAYSDYKITKSPFGRDYLKEIVSACHKANMPIGLYYSQRDWYHPHYDPDDKFPDRDHHKYIEYMHNTVRELLTNYGKIDILWLDAAWYGRMFIEEDWDSEKLYRMVRALQPGIIINNRASIPGDFDTPEQHVGHFQNDRPWESCITIAGGWAWRPNSNPKSLEKCITLLAQTVTGDGNLLLNLGPKADGTFEPNQVERTEQIGKWLTRYGESIYATRGGPWKNGDWGGATYRKNIVYVHVLKWPEDKLALPPLKEKILSAELLTRKGEVKFEQTCQAVTFTLAESRHDQIDIIIKLTLNKPLKKINSEPQNQ